MLWRIARKDLSSLGAGKNGFQSLRAAKTTLNSVGWHCMETSAKEGESHIYSWIRQRAWVTESLMAKARAFHPWRVTLPSNQYVNYINFDFGRYTRACVYVRVYGRLTPVVDYTRPSTNIPFPYRPPALYSGMEFHPDRKGTPIGSFYTNRKLPTAAWVIATAVSFATVFYVAQLLAF